jgi:phosphoenolpyruvate phosphomutase
MQEKNIHELLGKKEDLLVIGAHDGMSARLGELEGFDAIWGSGFEIAASHGLPDANILDLNDQLTACCKINDAITIPVIADCDNGYGNAINAAHTAKKFSRAGIAGICIEDNVFPKRCSFYEGVQRELVPGREHALKVRAAKDATNGALFVIARTEALIAGRSMAEALDRASLYAESGADAVLIHSKEKTPRQLIEFAAHWQSKGPRAPLVAVPTTYDTIPAQELHRLGYKIVIFANQGLRSATKAMRESLRRLRAAGKADVLRTRMDSLQDIFGLVHLKELEAAEQKYLLAPEKPRHPCNGPKPKFCSVRLWN